MTPGDRRFLGILAACVAFAGVSSCDEVELDNEPPHVPRIPRVERIEVDRFNLSWDPASDDHTPVTHIQYELGVVTSDVCIVQEPDYTLTALTELAIATPWQPGDGPFVGFTVRSLDSQRYSRGYGPCSWALRSPVRLPVAIDFRSPRLRPAPATGPTTDCRSDGNGGVWCISDTEISQFSNNRWESLPFPTGFSPTGWTPLDQYAALVRNERVELEMSRANGLHAYALSSGSELFDALGGAVSLSRDRAFVVVRGHVGELRPGFIDMAGPPAALRLPRRCERILQLGQEGDLAFALCRDGSSHVVFIGEERQRVIGWQVDPIEVSGDRVEGILGTLDSGYLAVTSPEDGWLVGWQSDNRETISIDGLAGEGRPVIAVGGRLDSVLAVAARNSEYMFFEGAGWHPMPRDGDEIRWRSARFLAQSHLVGSELGVYVINRTQTVRLDRQGAQLSLRHPGDAVGVRGGDSRHFVLRGPVLRELLSTRHGHEWYSHTWRGPELEPVSVAVTPSGGIYVSGWRLDAATGERSTPFISKFGQDEDLTPAQGSSHLTTPPVLAADGRGELYAYAAEGVIWYDPITHSWYPAAPLPGRLHALVGLSEGVLAATVTADGPRLVRCQRELCFDVPIPGAANHAFGGVFSHDTGFCVGIESRALWCRGDDDEWMPVRFSEESEERHRLRPEDEWSILDAFEVESGRWLLAVETELDGFLVLKTVDSEEALVLANGLKWATGAVLINPDEPFAIIALEEDGPVRLRYVGGRITVPGSLYP